MTESLHICAVCAYEYEQPGKTGRGFHDLPDEWQCPVCDIGKLMFHHYACSDIIHELTGNLSPQQPFGTVDLPHLNI